MANRRAQFVNAARNTYGRLAHGRLDARAGYVYAWRRALAGKLEHASQLGPGPEIDELTVRALASRSDGLVHECEPAEAIPFSHPPVYTKRRWLVRDAPA